MWKLFLWPVALLLYTLWERYKFWQYVAAPTDGLDLLSFGLAMSSFVIWDIILKVSLGLYAVSVFFWIMTRRRKKLPLQYNSLLLLGPLSLLASFIIGIIYLFLKNYLL